MVTEPNDGSYANADDESQRMFEASGRNGGPANAQPVTPWGGSGAPLWKRFFAAWIRTGDIRIGRFPK